MFSGTCIVAISSGNRRKGIAVRLLVVLHMRSCYMAVRQNNPNWCLAVYNLYGTCSAMWSCHKTPTMCISSDWWGEAVGQLLLTLWLVATSRPMQSTHNHSFILWDANFFNLNLSKLVSWFLSLKIWSTSTLLFASFLWPAEILTRYR